MTEDTDPYAEEVAAIKRISFTSDGHLLHRFLRRVLEGCFDFPESSALHAHNGRRSLARDLMGHMAEGLETSGRANADPGNLPLARSRRANPVRRPRGVQRRVQPLDSLAPDRGGGDGGAGDDDTA